MQDALTKHCLCIGFLSPSEVIHCKAEYMEGLEGGHYFKIFKKQNSNKKLKRKKQGCFGSNFGGFKSLSIWSHPLPVVNDTAQQGMCDREASQRNQLTHNAKMVNREEDAHVPFQYIFQWSNFSNYSNQATHYKVSTSHISFMRNPNHGESNHKLQGSLFNIIKYKVCAAQLVICSLAYIQSLASVSSFKLK